MWLLALYGRGLCSYCTIDHSAHSTRLSSLSLSLCLVSWRMKCGCEHDKPHDDLVFNVVITTINVAMQSSTYMLAFPEHRPQRVLRTDGRVEHGSFLKIPLHPILVIIAQYPGYIQCHGGGQFTCSWPKSNQPTCLHVTTSTTRCRGSGIFALWLITQTQLSMDIPDTKPPFMYSFTAYVCTPYVRTVKYVRIVMSIHETVTLSEYNHTSCTE